MNNFSIPTIYLWLGLLVVIIGSIVLILQGFKVNRLFADSLVGKLVKTLVVVLLIELASLGVISFAFLFFYPRGFWVVLPVIALWVISLFYAIAAVKDTTDQVTKLTK